MSDTSQGPGWWRASDGKFYPPQEPPPLAPPTWSTSDEARRRIQWKADRRRGRGEWWGGLGRSRQIVLVSIVVTLTLGLTTVVATVDSRTRSSDATARACGSYWVVAVNVFGGNYSGSPEVANGQLDNDLHRVALDATEAAAPVRDAAAAEYRNFMVASGRASGERNGETEFLTFTRSLGAMAGACTDAGHPNPVK